MWYLLLALICACVKGYCGKRVSGFVKQTADATLANLLRMLICVAIGFFTVAIPGGFGGFGIGGRGIFISLLSGASNALFVVSWLFAVKSGAYMLVNVFLTLGNILPIALCAIFFDELIEWNHVLGFCVLIIAVFIMCSYNNTVKAKLSPGSLILLLVCGAGQGLCSFTQKWFTIHTSGEMVAAFNFYTYLFSSLILGCYLLVSRARTVHKTEMKLKPIWYMIVVMAVMLFFNSYFMTLAASVLPTTVLYPMSTGLSLTLSTLMSSIFFKERPNAKCIVGLILAFCALLIINLL